MARMKLLSMPNELFPFIFKYLSSGDIVHAFVGLRSRRLRALIHPFISRLNIADRSDEWVQSHLSTVLAEHDIHAIRVRGEQLASVSGLLLSNNVRSVHILADHSYNEAETFLSSIEPLRRQLKILSIDFGFEEIMGLAPILFHSDSQLRQLTIRNSVFVHFEEDSIGTCTRLAFLSIEVEGTHLLFILLKHLPVLEELKVKFISNECIVQPKPNTEGVSACAKLRRVTMTGFVKYFDHLADFFAIFGSTVEELLINIDLLWRSIDGKELEQQLLDKMPLLSEFEFCIRSIDADSTPIEIETFKSFAWERFPPVVYCNDGIARRHTTFTLPYRFHEFTGLSNEYVSSCVANQSVTLRLDNVRSLSLNATTPFTSESFEFIREVFPNVKTLECAHWVRSDEHDDDDDEQRPVSFIDAYLLSDMNLQLPSITKLHLCSWSYKDDHAAFRRLILLFPNMIELEMDARELPQPDGWQSEENHEQISAAFARIKLLKLHYRESDNTKLREAQIHTFFPNAAITVAVDTEGG